MSKSAQESGNWPEQHFGIEEQLMKLGLDFEGLENEELEGEGETELSKPNPKEYDKIKYPYGPLYEKLTKIDIQEVIYELGLITLTWPDESMILQINKKKHLPSYITNSKKEKLVLWYAENFRKQYHSIYPDRAPLMLAPENECALQKMVCTTIRPTTLPYPEFYTWQGCACFVSDHLDYKPLRNPTGLVCKMSSPTNVLTKQFGNCFEYSTLLCSYLIGSGFDAYVVSGYASREFCLNDKTMVTCPYLEQAEPEVEEEEEVVAKKKDPAEGEAAEVEAVEGEAVEGEAVKEKAVKEEAAKDEAMKEVAIEGEDVKDEVDKDEVIKEAVKGDAVKEEVAEGEVVKGEAVEGEAAEGKVDVEKEKQSPAKPRFKLKSKRVIESKFHKQLKLKEELKIKAEEEAEKEEERRIIEDWEKPEPDDLHGLRVHSWILLLPGKRQVKETLFIDPVSGNGYPVSDHNFLGIESVWNPTNYWINLQCCSEGCGNLKFDLTDLQCWQHLLPGEPWTSRVIPKDIQEPALVEKHLDMPPSWVARLTLDHCDYERRFPKGSKCTFFKKSKVEQYAPFIHPDGLSLHVLTYQDYSWDTDDWRYEYYLNRTDCMIKVEKDFNTEQLKEYFNRGRTDALKSHKLSFFLSDFHLMEFYYKARIDNLDKLETDKTTITEYFTDRDDFLYYRQTTTEEKPINKIMGKRVLKVVERFHRDQSKTYDMDVAERTFHIANHEIHLVFHISDSSVSASRRTYIKPPLAEMGGRLTFDSENTFAYQSDPFAEPPRMVDVYYNLKELLKSEEMSLFRVREIQDELQKILAERKAEIAASQLKISIFDKDRNVMAKRRMKEKEEQLRAESAKEVEKTIDYVSPYLAQAGLMRSLTKKQATALRDQCLTDTKRQLVSRANALQSAFEEHSEKLREKYLWYEKNQDLLTRTDEEEYHEFVTNTRFIMHTLELRLNRLRDQSRQNYLAVDRALRRDKRLAIMYW